MEDSSQLPLLRSVFGRNLYIAQYIEPDVLTKKYKIFEIPNEVEYFPFSKEDSGPTTMSSIIKFCRSLEEAIESDIQGVCWAIYLKPGKDSLMNAGA